MKKNNKSEYYTGGETKMISESYIKDLLLSMGYIKKNHIYEKFFPSVDCYIKVDLKNRTIIYPEDRGMTISNRTTCNFSAPENFVVLECVTRLFDKGYRPEHLNLEKSGRWGMSRKADGLIFAYLIRKGIRCLLLSVKLTAENMKRNIKI